ncbi:MAG TPA: HET-C-related protein [Polyangiaceae bacterium]
MDLAIHDEILWCACVKASRRLTAAGKLADPAHDPRSLFPWMVRGSWMNDMNQVTPLIDFAQNPNIGPQQDTLFQGLWKVAVQDLLQNTAHRYAHNEPLLQAAPGIIASKKHNIDGFGHYNRFDHLDVEENHPATEYDGAWASNARLGRARTAHFTVTSHVRVRLTGSLLDDDRLEPRSLTSLGRALHTVADVFAHSNYVELLLWSLAWRGRLEPDFINAFNFDDGSDNAAGSLLRCPLPAHGPRAENLLRNAVLWYGDSPQETPFVSALFDKSDTIFSLLHIYAAHLLRTDGKPQTEPMLDIAMALFDIQGAKLIKGAWAVLEGIGNVFDAIGQGARNLLARGLDSAADRSTNSTARDLMHDTAHLVRHYDSKKAKDWAEAGRLNFLARELQIQMLEELRGQSPATKLLPHHALLAKDHVEDEAGGRIRFKLGCLLATEVSAQIIERHFSPEEPSLGDYDQMASRVLIHPWWLLEQHPNFDKTLAPLVQKAGGHERWQDQSISGLELLAGVL